MVKRRRNLRVVKLLLQAAALLVCHSGILNCRKAHVGTYVSKPLKKSRKTSMITFQSCLSRIAARERSRKLVGELREREQICEHVKEGSAHQSGTSKMHLMGPSEGF